MRRCHQLRDTQRRKVERREVAATRGRRGEKVTEGREEKPEEVPVFQPNCTFPNGQGWSRRSSVIGSRRDLGEGLSR